MRRLFGPFFVFAGVMHFLRTRWYERIMPPYIPYHRELVYASGVAEIAGGLATMHPATRRAGSLWSNATLVAALKRMQLQVRDCYAVLDESAEEIAALKCALGD